MQKPNTEHHPDKTPSTDQDEIERDRKDQHDHDEEQLDETIDESFPASDPPANY